MGARGGVVFIGRRKRRPGILAGISPTLNALNLANLRGLSELGEGDERRRKKIWG
jgi:hypothetical protein